MRGGRGLNAVGSCGASGGKQERQCAIVTLLHSKKASEWLGPRGGGGALRGGVVWGFQPGGRTRVPPAEST